MKAISDYYPFGMLMPKRGYSSQVYRFGFNGQEKDDELNGEGNTYSFEYRVHDVRLGRFLSLDPIMNSFSWNSPYSFCENRVIDGVDLEGKEWSESTSRDMSTGIKTVNLKLKIKVVDNSKIMNAFNREAYMQQIKISFEKQFTQFDKDNNIQYTAELEYEFVEEADGSPSNDVTRSNDFVVEFADYTGVPDGTPLNDKHLAGFTSIMGGTQINRLYIALGQVPDASQPSEIKDNSENFAPEPIEFVARTFCGEAGHSMGLLHPYTTHPDKSIDPKTIALYNSGNLSEDNFMLHRSSDSGSQIEMSQLEAGAGRIQQQQSTPNKPTAPIIPSE